MALVDFLENKPLYFKKIDYERMPKVYEKIKSHFSPTKTIHIIGTNGKGTTGRFLATALFKQGYKVGHYTSPHILKFNERVWLNGRDCSTAILECAHQKLQILLNNEDSNSLSYFEYTTFLAMLTFHECEYIVLEAGLGGIHDATAVFPKILTLVTPIDYDHEAFLGSSIHEIAKEKLSAIQNNAITALQKNETVYEVAKSLASTQNIVISNLDDILSKLDDERILAIAQDLNLATYLRENLKLSIAALKFFNLEYAKSDFEGASLFGRLSKINENIIVDVGHNILAATSVAKSLLGEKYILIYNTYEDKDYKNILRILEPIIEKVEIIDIIDERIEKKEKLQKVLNDLKIEYTSHEKVDKNRKYLVFGSFRVVEAFITKELNE